MSLDVNTYTDMIDNAAYFQVDVIDDHFEIPSYLANKWLEERKEVIVLDSLSEDKVLLTPFELHSAVPDEAVKRIYQAGKFIRLSIKWWKENIPTTEKSKVAQGLLKRIHYSWYNAMEEYLQSEEFRNINNQANNVARKTKTIFPLKENVYKALSFDLMKTRVVILGQDCYPNVHASGLAFATTQITKPVSFRQLERAIQQDLNYPIEWKLQNDLINVANQGVVLLNSAFTVEERNPGSYLDLWQPFTAQVVKTLNNLPKPVIFILMGKSARGFKKYITENKHTVYEISHPASAAYNNSVWDVEHVFSRTNEILAEMQVPIIKW